MPQAGLDRYDFGDTVDAVAHDAFDAGLERVRRRRAGPARAEQAHGDNAGGLVDIAEKDVTAVGLKGGPDHLDGLFDLLAHHHTLRWDL